MSYLLAQILVCLLVAGVIGGLIGWWLRGGCKKKLRSIENEWSAKYDTDRAIWQGKIDAAEEHIQRSLHKNNSEWDVRLRDAESTWEGKVQGLVGNYDAKLVKLNRDREALEDELLSARGEAKRLKEQLEKIENQWNLKLKDVESSWEGKVQSIKSDYTSKAGDNDQALQALKDELARTKKELVSSEEKLQDVAASYEDKIHMIKDNYTSKVDSLNDELEVLKDELATTQASLTAVNDEWSMKLKDVESNWESKVQSVKSNFESKSTNNDSELKALREKLEDAQAEANEAKSALTRANDQWNLKLKDVESSWESKVQAVKSDYESKTVDKDRLKALEAELEKAKADTKNAELKLTQVEDEWKFKVKDIESNWEGKVQSIKSDYEAKAGSSDEELEALKVMLEKTKAELATSNETWRLKLQDVESKAGSSEGELKALKDDLEKARKEADEAKGNLSKVEDEWSLKLKDSNSNWEGKIQAVKSDYESKAGNSDKELEKLKAELDKTKSELKSSDDTWKLKLKDIEAKADSADKRVKSLESDLSNAQTEAKKAKAELASLNDEWSKKLKHVDSSWEGKIQTIMSEHDSKLSAADKEKASLKANLNSAKAEADAAKDEMLKADGELFGALGHIEDSYEVEALEGIGAGYGKKFRALGVTTTDEFASKFLGNEKEAAKAAKETGIDKDAITNTGTSTTSGHLNECYEIEEVDGIGPGYGKRFRKLGINTTCDLANTYLRDNKAIKKASKKMGVDFDAIKAWASIADLMRLPGVDGQYAEIMQTVGLDSRKELTHISLNHLHELMVEFNAKNPIVPEVPTMDMLVAWSSAAKKQK